MCMEKKSVTPDKIITIMGIGGGANSVLNHLKDKLPEGYYFKLVCVNTDKQILETCKTDKLQIGEKTANGLGCGGNPEKGKKAAEESRQKIKKEILGSDKLILISCLGGGTGTGATPVIAETAQEFGIETTVFTTLPFSFEGKKRRITAAQGIKELPEHTEINVLNNDDILEEIERTTTIKEAFSVINEVLSKNILTQITGK